MNIEISHLIAELSRTDTGGYILSDGHSLLLLHPPHPPPFGTWLDWLLDLPDKAGQISGGQELFELDNYVIQDRLSHPINIE